MKKGMFSIIAGLLLVAAALCLTGYNLWDDYRAGKAADAALNELLPMISEDAVPAQGRVVNTIPTAPEDETAPAIEEIEYPSYILNPNMEMPIQTIDGHDYIGVVYIAPLDREFPVISEWSYSNLDIAPCRFSGSAYLDDLVICAHNYSMHFGQLRELKLGDSVRFTDMDGNRFEYTISEIETLQPTMVDQMTTGEWDLTLFTCTVGGRTRLALRCDRVK